jgi:RNA polymerase sigma-B factor
VATTHLTHARTHERNSRASRTAEILDELDRTTSPERREHLFDELVEANMGVARSIALRYRNRGICDDDLVQVAYLALVRTARAYDHSTGHDFMSYVVPSIRGEVRRHFRDHGWMVRPPRRVQEIQSGLERTESYLQASLGRAPEPEELAAEMGVSVAEIREALAATACFSPVSLDQVTSSETTTRGDRMGAPDHELDVIEARLTLAPLMQDLDARERRILELRFFRDCTQQEIADEIGVTQMQVSRLLSGLMARMRSRLEAMGSGTAA